MATASGSQRQISHYPEATFGTGIFAAMKTDRFLAGARIYNDVDDITSDELRSDRAVAPGSLGARHCKGTFPFELSVGSDADSGFDDYIQSAMCSPWVPAAAAAAAQTVTVVAGSTNTMGAASIGTGLAVGDWIKVSLFAGAVTSPPSTLGSNNGFFRVTARAAALITLAEAVNADGTSRLYAGVSGATVVIQKMASIVAGTTRKGLSLELAQPDVSVWQNAYGFIVNKMALSVKQGAKITGSFDGVGLSLSAPAGSKIRTGTDVPATTSAPITSYSSSSFLYLDGVPFAIATSLDLSLDNGMEELMGVFQAVANDILMGRSNLSGSITIAYTGSTYLAKALANQHVALRVQMVGPDGSGYAIDIPNVRLKMPSEDTSENKVFHTYAWQAEKETSDTLLVNCKISKLV